MNPGIWVFSVMLTN